MLTVAAIALLAVSSRLRLRLPEPAEISAELYEDPFQGETDEEEFVFEYLGQEFNVKPVAEYEITGLIVSHNNTTSISDMYHDAKSVDFKDLCLVWGNNVRSDIYKKVNFTSAPWTCYFKTDTREQFKQFDKLQISNNHILTGKKEIRELIKNMTIGDQIALRGWLVNYAPSQYPDYKRESSLVRTDIGNGACEVFFIEQAEIIQKANSGWHDIYRVSKLATMLGLLINILIFILSTYKAHQR